MGLSTLLRSRCTIKRQGPSPSKDASGAAVRSWPTAIAVDEPCDIQPAGASIRTQFLQNQLVVTHTIYFARDVGIREYDRVETDDGRIFLVQRGGYQPPSVGYGEWPSQVHAEEQVV